MTSKENTIQEQLAPPSWQGVRGIYKKLSDEFQTLTQTFHIEIDSQTKIHLDHLIIAIDVIDTCVDELPSKEERDSITNSLIEFLWNDDETWSHPSQSPTIASKIENLKRVVQQLNISANFIGAAKTIFYNTEIKRHTSNVDDLINYVILEGKATAILPLSIMDVKSETPFGLFFTKLCMLMGIVDLIFDARQDYKQNYIALRPNLELYTKLVKLAIKDGLSLLLSIPRKFQFLKYCIRFAFALMKG